MGVGKDVDPSENPEISSGEVDILSSSIWKSSSLVTCLLLPVCRVMVPVNKSSSRILPVPVMGCGGAILETVLVLVVPLQDVVSLALSSFWAVILFSIAEVVVVVGPGLVIMPFTSCGREEKS